MLPPTPSEKEHANHGFQTRAKEMKTPVYSLLVHRQAGRWTLRSFCPLRESDRLEDTGLCVLSEMIDQSREDTGSQVTQEEPRLLSSSGEAERGGVLAGSSSAVPAGRLAVMGKTRGSNRAGDR